MNIETAKEILIKSLSSQDELLQEAIKSVLAELEKSEPEPLRVTYSNDEKYAYFNGRKYRKDGYGYYMRLTSLHIDVMEYFTKRIIPQGYDVHHNGKDENGEYDKRKNDIEHLILMESSDHHRLHLSTKLKERITSICVNCGKEFETFYEHQKYCSENCRREYSEKKPVERICQRCGKRFKAPQGSKRKLCNEHTTKKCKLIIDN